MYNRYREEEKEEIKETKENEAAEATEPQEEEQQTEKAPEAEADFVAEVKKLQDEVKRLTDLYLRTLADAENFKKRINEERIRERKYGAQYLLEKLIVVVDIFGKALSLETDDVRMKNFLIGFEMIYKQFNQILEDEGVKKIETANQKFNPLYHHAVELGCVEGLEDEMIIEEIQSGYMYKDRVLRPAFVKVNKIQKEEKEDGENNRN